MRNRSHGRWLIVGRGCEEKKPPANEEERIINVLDFINSRGSQTRHTCHTHLGVRARACSCQNEHIILFGKESSPCKSESQSVHGKWKYETFFTTHAGADGQSLCRIDKICCNPTPSWTLWNRHQMHRMHCFPSLCLRDRLLNYDKTETAAAPAIMAGDGSPG